MRLLLPSFILFLLPSLGFAQSPSEVAADPVIFDCQIRDRLASGTSSVQLKNTDVQYSFPESIRFFDGYEVVVSARITRSEFDQDGYLRRAVTLKVEVRDQDHVLEDSATREISDDSKSTIQENISMNDADVRCVYHVLEMRILPEDSLL